MTQFNTTTLDAQITALEAQVNHAVDYAHDSAQGQALRRNIQDLKDKAFMARQNAPYNVRHVFANLNTFYSTKSLVSKTGRSGKQYRMKIWDSKKGEAEWFTINAFNEKGIKKYDKVADLHARAKAKKNHGLFVALLLGDTTADPKSKSNHTNVGHLDLKLKTGVDDSGKAIYQDIAL